MDNNPRKNDKRIGYAFVKLALYIFLPYIILPCVPVILPQLFRYIIILSVNVLLLLGSLENKSTELKKIFGTLFLVVIFSYLYYIGVWQIQGKSFVSIFATSIMFWNGLLFAIYIVNEFTENDKNKFYKFAILLILITIITTIIGNSIYPEASRLLASGERSPELQILYRKMNIGGYAFIYSLVIAIPLFVHKYHLVNKISMKLMYLLLIIFTAFVCLITQYTIAFVTMFIVLLIMVVFKLKNKLLSLIVLITATILTNVFKETIIGLLVSIKTVLLNRDLTTIADRIKNIIDIFKGTDISGDAFYRSNFYKQSWEIFLKHPIIGCFKDRMELGGHSELLDVLGGTGLVGFLILVSLLIIHLKNVNRYKESRKYFVYSFISFLIIASFNTVLNAMPIAITLFLIPALIGREVNNNPV